MAAERTFQRLVAQLDYPMFIATVAAGGELAELFGGETGDELDRFERCAWRPGPGDVPLIDDCPNRFVGRIGERVGFSDHVGLVLEPFHAEEDEASGQLGSPRDRGPARGARRLDPAAGRGGARHLVARERGLLRREPLVLRGPAGGGRRHPGRPHRRLRGAGHQGDARRLRFDRPVGDARWGVAQAAIIVLVYQGALSLGATLFEDILQGEASRARRRRPHERRRSADHRDLAEAPRADRREGRQLLPALVFAPALVGIVSLVD